MCQPAPLDPQTPGPHAAPDPCTPIRPPLSPAGRGGRITAPGSLPDRPHGGGWHAAVGWGGHGPAGRGGHLAASRRVPDGPCGPGPGAAVCGKHALPFLAQV